MFTSLSNILPIALAAILLNTALVCAQPPDTLWTRAYGGGNHDEAFGVLQTDDGGYVMAGYTESFGAGGADQYVVKTDAAGDTLWTRTYGESIIDNYCEDIQKTADGGYILAGFSGIYPAWDATLRKLDANGNSQWSYSYNGGSDDYGKGVCQSSDGGYVLVGTTMSGGYQVLLLKTDANGVYQWHRIILKPGVDNGNCVQETSDGGFIIAGQTDSYTDVWLLKTDALGYLQWDRSFSGGDGADGRCVQQTEDDGYIIAGYGSFGGTNDLWLIRTDASGNPLWNRTYGRGGSEMGRRVLITDGGGYIVAGYTSSGNESYNILLLRTDGNGGCLWYTTIGGNAGDGSYGLDKTDVGGYVVGGTTKSFGAGYRDFYMAVFEPEGPFRTDAEELSVGEWNFYSNEISTFRESPPSQDNSILRIYPNPFNPITTISFCLPQACFVKLEILDINGRNVGAQHAAPLLNGWGSAGYHEVTFDGSGLASGIYIYRLRAGNFSANGKMVLMK